MKINPFGFGFAEFVDTSAAAASIGVSPERLGVDSVGTGGAGSPVANRLIAQDAQIKALKKKVGGESLDRSETLILDLTTGGVKAPSAQAKVDALIVELTLLGRQDKVPAPPSNGRFIPLRPIAPAPSGGSTSTPPRTSSTGGGGGSMTGTGG